MPSACKLAAMAAAALCAVTAGCTTGKPGSDQTPSPSTQSSTPPVSGPATLRFAVYGDRAVVAAYTDLAEAFTRKNPRVKIKVEQAPDAASATNELAEEFATSNAPDVFLTAQEQLPGLLAEGRVQPVDVLLEERGVDFGDGYQRDGLEAFSAEAALQCMPADVSPLVVYYNKDVFDPRSLVEEEGDEPPNAREGWSWEEFATAARRIARHRAAGVHIEPDLEALAPFIWSAGGDIVDDLEFPTSLTMSAGDTRGAVEEVLALVRAPGVTPTAEELARQGPLTRFSQGKLGMILGTRALVPELRAFRGLDFEAFPLPSLGGFRTISSITGYCMSSGTEHVKAAADFITFAVGREGATITSQSGHVVPSNVEVLHSPAFTQPGRQPANAFLFSQGVRRANETPFVAEWPQVLSQTRPLLKRMFYAPVIDLESMLAQIDARSQVLLAPEEESDGEPEEE